jgi:hypothetical protein
MAAFMIAYPHWWDHRAVGIDGGAVDWPNSILKAEDVHSSSPMPICVKTAINPSGKDFLFFYSQDDKSLTDCRGMVSEWKRQAG